MLDLYAHSHQVEGKGSLPRKPDPRYPRVHNRDLEEGGCRLAGYSTRRKKKWTGRNRQTARMSIVSIPALPARYGVSLDYVTRLARNGCDCDCDYELEHGLSARARKAASTILRSADGPLRLVSLDMTVRSDAGTALSARTARRVRLPSRSALVSLWMSRPAFLAPGQNSRDSLR